MKKYLIIGASGFVGRYFMRFLDELNTHAYVIGITRNQEKFQIYKNPQLTIQLADLTNRLRIQDILAYYRPDYVVHLASDSSVAYSWKYPIDSFHNNTNFFLNLLESIRVLQIPCRVLSVGSSEEYGIVSGHTIPLKETALLNPISPYAVARVSQELLSKVYADSFGIDIVLTRSFNHMGPEQKEAFVISSFAKQVI